MAVAVAFVKRAWRAPRQDVSCRWQRRRPRPQRARLRDLGTAEPRVALLLPTFTSPSAAAVHVVVGRTPRCRRWRQAQPGVGAMAVKLSKLRELCRKRPTAPAHDPARATRTVTRRGRPAPLRQRSPAL